MAISWQLQVLCGCYGGYIPLFSVNLPCVAMRDSLMWRRDRVIGEKTFLPLLYALWYPIGYTILMVHLHLFKHTLTTHHWLRYANLVKDRGGNVLQSMGLRRGWGSTGDQHAVSLHVQGIPLSQLVTCSAVNCPAPPPVEFKFKNNLCPLYFHLPFQTEHEK